MLRIHELKLKWDEDVKAIPHRIEKKLERVHLSVKDWQIVKESIDAREKNNVKRVFTVDFTVKTKANETAAKKEQRILQAAQSIKQVKLEIAMDKEYPLPQAGTKPLKYSPVIVGFGPCGMFAALLLSQLGYCPIVLERGKSMAERVADVEQFWQTGVLLEESNVQFGEGGAGTFSDGKLTTQIRDPRISFLLKELVAAGAPAEILYQHKAHIGTDLLRQIVVHIRNKVINNGGEIHFQSKVTDVIIENGCVQGVEVNGTKMINTEQIILAIGHSARDTFRMLYEKKVPMAQKPFSIGVRIEHPQKLIDEAQYGKREIAEKLGPADYKLSYRCPNGRGVYTFCMCPGGVVVGAASANGAVVTNGMSYHDRAAENANSALLVDVKTTDFPAEDVLAGVALQETYEQLAFELGGKNYHAPAQRLGDFLDGVATKEDHAQKKAVRPSYQPGVCWTDLSQCLPDFVVTAMKEAIPVLGRRLPGFDSADAVLTGVETRSSSPVRILRLNNQMSEVKGLYPAGEGAGYAGGIVSAAVDGMKAAEEIIKTYNKPSFIGANK